MKYNIQKMLVRAAILLVLALGSFLSIYAMDGAQSAGFGSAGFDAAAQQDVPFFNIQDSHALTVTVSATNGAGTYQVGDVLYLKFGFKESTTLADGNLNVNFSTGASGAITPFANKTLVGLTYTIPSGFGEIPQPQEFISETAAAVQFNVTGFSLAPGATLTSGGEAKTAISVAPGENLSDNVDIVVNESTLNGDALCAAIQPFTPTANAAPESPNYICGLGNGGEPIIKWRYDPNADWYHLWVGRLGTTTTPFYQAVDTWFSVEPNNFDYPQATCEGLTCTAKLGGINYVFAQGGEFQVWMEAWGNNQFSSGGTGSQIDPGAAAWNGPAYFSLSAQRPGGVSGITITTNNDGAITLGWEASAGSTWYAVWLGTAPTEWSPRSFFWIDAITAGCVNGGTCWVAPGTTVLNFSTGNPSSFSVSLQNDEYIFYVGSWGPGGFSDAGEYDPDGGFPPLEMWATGPQFTVTDGEISVSG